MAGRKSDEHVTKYVHSSPSFSNSPRSGLFSDASFFLLLSVAALILFLNNALSSFFFQTHFYPRTFLCCCGAVFYNAVAFNGDLSTWDVGKVTIMDTSTFINNIYYMYHNPIHVLLCLFHMLFFFGNFCKTVFSCLYIVLIYTCTPFHSLSYSVPKRSFKYRYKRSRFLRTRCLVH